MSLEEEEGIQISAPPDNTESPKSSDNSDEQSSLGLGDRVQIESKKLGTVIGRIYYIDDELIRVLPDGISNRLYDFPITAEGFDSSLGVTEFLTEPTKIPGFIEQNRLRVGLKIDTFLPDGEEYKSYTIEAVDVDTDTIVIVDENGYKETVEFAFTGIPRDIAFEVIRIASEAEPEPVTEEDEDEAAAAEQQQQQEGQEEEEDQILGVIEVPIMMEVSEIPTSDRVYPETAQKNDFLVDFLTFLDSSSQKNVNIIRQVRAFVEVANSMARQVINYAQDGTPVGGKSASVTQLLELLNSGKVPLMRPVLDAIRVLYVDHSEDYLARTAAGIPSSEEEYKSDTFDVNYLSNSIKKAEAISQVQNAAPKSDIGIPRFYNDLNDIAQAIQRPWRDTNVGTQKFEAKIDTDIFRGEAPSDEATIPGLNATHNPKQSINGDPENLNGQKVQFSLLRALAATMRKSKTGKYVLALPSDKASLISYLLFPIAVSNILGSKRTGTLSRDVGRSSMIPKSMKEVIDEIGEPSEIPSATTILNVGLHGNTLGNIEISDYLQEVLKLVEQQFIGFGDFQTMLTDLGLDAYELTQETTEILQHRVLEDIARIKSTIGAMRENAAQQVEPVHPIISFLDETGATAMKTRIQTEPILVESLKELPLSTPLLADIDIAILSYLLTTKQDLTIATLGGQEPLIQRERLRAQADTYIKTVRDAIILRRRQEEGGSPPVKNKCEHVPALVSIRKVKDTSERFSLLAKLISQFQGTRDENFVNCIVCDQHLVCMHEVLQIQMFYKPREKEVLQKELYLKMSGGVFCGRYICRNCGQSISDLQFDNNLESNDKGAAIMGTDTDEELESKTELELGGLMPAAENITFDNEAKNVCYYIAKEIYSRVGIQPELSDYRNIVESAFLRLQTLDSKDDYTRKQAAAAKKGMKGIVDYDTYVKGSTVVSTAALVLLDVQTHIPDYVIRYTLPGCEAGFGGFPLHGNDKMTGVQYVSCAVGSVVKNEEPWNKTGFQKIRSDADRQKTISKFMEAILNRILATEPTFQQKISAKLEYLRETFGAEAAEGRLRDKIPFGFLPLQERIAALEEGTQVVVPEAADKNDKIAQRKLAAAWIRDGHRHALRTAQLVRGNPFAETSCCFGPIGEPGAYWKDQKITIPLGKRYVPVSPLFRTSILFTHFTPKSMTELPVEAPLNLAFRIFLKVCYAGPRIGYAHELGYNGVCDNCGLKLSAKYLYPDYSVQTSRKSSQPIINTGELIADLEAQGVNVTPEFFQEILDTSHLNYLIPPLVAKKVTPANELMRRLGNLEPTPLPEWREVLTELITRLTTLTKTPDEAEIAIAYGPLSDSVGEAEDFIRRRFGASSASTVLTDWLSKTPFTLKEIIISYLIVPFQRLLGNFDTGKLRVPGELYNIGIQHEIDLNDIIKRHVEANTRFGSSFTAGGIARAKIEYFLKQIQGYLTFTEEMNPSRVPGGAIGVKYIRNALFLGPFAELLDFNKTPPGSGGEVAATSLVDQSGTSLVMFLTAIFKQYGAESLSYSPEEIKLRIAKAKEKEKMNFIGDKDKMDDEAKKVDNINQALGIGKWAIGGSKLIYAYDAGQYEREREDRIRRGETDLPYLEETGRQTHNVVYEFGGVIPGQADFYENQGGFDVAQEDPDDF
jgi:hypothetical protein